MYCYPRLVASTVVLHDLAGIVLLLYGSVAGTVLLLLDQSLAPYCYPDSVAGAVLPPHDLSLASYCYLDQTI